MYLQYAFQKQRIYKDLKLYGKTSQKQLSLGRA